MKHPYSKKLFTYWNNLRGKRIAPDRREIEPGDIRELLGETFILEIDRTYGTIAFRLAGTRLCNIYGKELKGQGFLSLWREQDNLEVHDLVQRVFDRCEPCSVTFKSKSRSGRSTDSEMILLPLMNGNDAASRILGAGFMHDLPAWSNFEPVIENELVEVKFLDRDAADAPSPFSPKILRLPVRHKPAGRKVGHLTVIEGGMRH